MATHQRGGGPQFGKGGNEETPVIPCKSVTSVQLAPQIGAESGGKLVPFAQRNCHIQISAENQLESTHSGRDAFQDSDGTLVPFSQGNGYESLVLPHKVSESLQLTSDPPKEVIDKLLHSLQLDDASLEDPKPETEKWIRCLTRDAKDRGRTDVVKYLREIMPAGTTGPMLPDTLPVQNIPSTQLKELTIDLSGRDDWELFAEKLGLTPAEIRFLDKRTLNQVLEVLIFAAQKYLITVGDLYDVLKDCGLPVIADFL